MNFPKGVQGILTLSVFIQLVICALAGAIFSSASQRAHAKVEISHMHETLSRKKLPSSLA